MTSLLAQAQKACNQEDELISITFDTPDGATEDDALQATTALAPVAHRVTYYYLSNVPDLTTFPASPIGGRGTLSNLTELFIVDCGLRELPADITALKSLQQLVLSNNQLRFLPPELGNLRELNTLFVDSNRLCFLPAQLTTSPLVLSLAVFEYHDNPWLTLDDLGRLSGYHTVDDVLARAAENTRAGQVERVNPDGDRLPALMPAFQDAVTCYRVRLQSTPMSVDRCTCHDSDGGGEICCQHLVYQQWRWEEGECGGMFAMWHDTHDGVCKAQAVSLSDTSKNDEYYYRVTGRRPYDAWTP